MEKFNECPICHKTFKESIWYHAQRQNHKDFILEQLKICNELFYDSNYNGQEIDNFYIPYFEVKMLWKKWFGIEEFEKRKSVQRSISNKKIDWGKVAEQSYYNEHLYFDHICPVCHKIGFNRTGHIDIVAHTKKHYKDPEHYSLLCQIVGDVLHREYWDNTCFYSKSAFYEILKKIKGKDYAINIRQMHRNTSQNGASGFRPDLGFNVNSSWEANIYRIIKYETKQDLNWIKGVDYEIPFDISEGNIKQTYYVDFYDKYGLFKKDAYVEIKGRYGNGAKRKHKLFRKLYPNLNYIMIGIPDKKSNFNPDINYLDLYNKYKDIIPHWEKFNEKVKNKNAFKERNDVEGTRKDLGIFTNSIYEANLLRIFKYEYGKNWKDYIEFDTKFNIFPYEKDIDNAYIARFYDKGNLFGPNVYIEIHKNIFAIDRNKISYAKEVNPDKKFITIGSEAFDDILYSDLEKKYQSLIPLWETEEHNFKTDRVTYDATYRKRINPKKAPQSLASIFLLDTIKSFAKNLDFNYQALPGKYDFNIYNLKDKKCPFCNEELTCAFIQHVFCEYEDKKHQDFLIDQARIIADLFWDISYHSNNDNYRYNLFFRAGRCRQLWKQVFSSKLYEERIKLAKYKNPCSEKEFHSFPQIKINNSGKQGQNMRLDYDYYINNCKKMDNVPEEYKFIHTNVLIMNKDIYHDYLLDQIYVAIQLFDNLSYSKKNPYHPDMSRNYGWVKKIWEKKFGKDKVIERENRR